MSPAAASLIDPLLLARVEGLEIAARSIVEGVRTGAHRSPHKGHSVDFADHRPYVAGDDLRHLDWKVLGRSDRLVLKRYEAETDVALHIAVDASASMGYAGSRGRESKYHHACRLAAALVHLAIDQGDRAALTVFADGVVSEVRPQRSGQLERVCAELIAREPATTTLTDAKAGLEHLGAPATERGFVVLISDLMADPAQIEAALDRLARRGHDVGVLWILDPDEADFSIDLVARFEGLEREDALTAEPRELRDAYLQVVEEHRQTLAAACLRRRLRLVEHRTDQPAHVALERLLR